MNVSRRADVPTYFCFFLTPNSREDIAFRKFRKKFDFFFREKFNILGGTLDPTTICRNHLGGTISRRLEELGQCRRAESKIAINM